MTTVSAMTCDGCCGELTHEGMLAIVMFRSCNRRFHLGAVVADVCGWYSDCETAVALPEL